MKLIINSVHVINLHFWTYLQKEDRKSPSSFLFCCFRVDRLSANIENQTEMLEKVCKFLAAKETIDIPPSHPATLDVKL